MKIFQVTESEQIPTKRQYWAPHGQYQLEKDKLKLYETSEQTLKDCEARLQDKDGIYNVTKAEEELAPGLEFGPNGMPLMANMGPGVPMP